MKSSAVALRRSARSLRAGRRVGLVKAKRGVQSTTMLALESRAPKRRGGIIGTAIMPAMRQPKKATMKSSPGGNIRSARSPLTAAHQLRRKRTGAALEFREGQRCLLAAAIGEKDIGALVRPLRGAGAQQLDHRVVRGLEDRRAALHRRDSLQSGSPAR